MRRSPLEHLENEVVEAFGRGAAVSLDHDRDENVWLVRAWSPKGYEALCSKPSRLQADAIRDLRKKVAEKLATTAADQAVAS